MLARRMMKPAESGGEVPYIQYTFDNAGNIGEQTGSSNYGDMVLDAGSVASVPGQVGLAAQLTAGRLKAVGPYTTIDKQDFTLVGWLYCPSVAQRGISPYSIGNAAPVQQSFPNNASNMRIVFASAIGSQILNFSSIPSTTGVWIFYAGRYIHATREFNGYVPISPAIFLSGTLSADCLPIDAMWCPQFTTDATVDAWRLYTRYLSDQELIDIYNAEK